MKNFYKLLSKSSKEAGILEDSDDKLHPTVMDGHPVENWDESIVLELKDGKYCPYDMCLGGNNAVNQELKELFQSYIGDDPNVEFLPVKATSKEYGDRMYYIVHFKEVYSDAIDKRHSHILSSGSIARYGLKYEKVKKLKVFTAKGNDIVVCPEIAAEMKKRKLDFGTELFPIKCYEEDER